MTLSVCCKVQIPHGMTKISKECLPLKFTNKHLIYMLENFKTMFRKASILPSFLFSNSVDGLYFLVDVVPAHWAITD